MTNQEIEQYIKIMTELSEKLNELKSFCVSHAEDVSASIPLQHSLTEKWEQLSTMKRQINVEIKLLQTKPR